MTYATASDGVGWQKIWSFAGGSGPVSVWRPTLYGHCSLGDVMSQHITQPPPGASFVRMTVAVSPISFIWKIAEESVGGINYWEPICPGDSIPLGHVGVQAPEVSKEILPPLDSACCVPASFASMEPGRTGVTTQLWTDQGTNGMDNTQWQRKNLATFYALDRGCSGRYSAPCYNIPQARCQPQPLSGKMRF